MLRTRRDVLRIFESLAGSEVPVTLYFPRLGTSFSSRLIAFNPAYEELIFDATYLPGFARLADGDELTAELNLNAVWYRFEAGHVQVVGGYPVAAIRARVPAVVARLQRRDSIRYPVPALNPPVCDVRLPGHDGDALHLRALDISCSGLALLIENGALEFKAGNTITGCLLHLPDTGSIPLDLNIAYVNSFGDAGSRRMGCRFTNLHVTSLDHLSRYIMRLERATQVSEEVEQKLLYNREK